MTAALIEAVFFDLYETLITEFDADWKPHPTVADRLGIDAGVFEREWRASRPARNTGALDYPSALRDICRKVDRRVNDGLIRQLYAERLTAKAVPFARLDDDVLAALEAIRSMGLRTGLISNCAPDEVVAWGSSALRGLLDDAVFSYQVGCQKPEREIYELACRGLGVAPEQSLFVGDGASAELSGAAQVGMTPCWATWFLDRWPAWKRAGLGWEKSHRYPRLRTPAELVAAVAARYKPEG